MSPPAGYTVGKAVLVGQGDEAVPPARRGDDVALAVRRTINRRVVHWLAEIVVAPMGFPADNIEGPMSADRDCRRRLHSHGADRAGRRWAQGGVADRGVGVRPPVMESRLGDGADPGGRDDGESPKWLEPRPHDPSPMLLSVTLRLGQVNGMTLISSSRATLSASSRSVPVIDRTPPVAGNKPPERVAGRDTSREMCVE